MEIIKKYFLKYHDKFGCKGHNPENTLFRCVGIVSFLVVLLILWTILTKSFILGIIGGILETILIDLVGGIGRKANFLDKF